VSEQALAEFDLLQIAAMQTEASAGMTDGELHMLAYLACLLAVYDGHRPPWWGYKFTATRTGAPFSFLLSTAQDRARNSGLIERREEVWTITDLGRVDLGQISEVMLNARRLPYLDAAAGAALAMPLPSVAGALGREPGLRRALRFVKTQELLDEAGLALLEDQFNALNEALAGDNAADDLMVPAVVWLTYLARRLPEDAEAA
jgi:hypothetical protein